MSLFRLLPPRLGSLINTVECRRWCSTVNDKGEILRPLQKSVVVEQQKAMAVETYEKKHMTENEGVFPRDTHVQKEVGPWNNLVAIFQIAKKKIFGNHMEQKSSSTHALTSTSDLKDSDNVVSADSHDSGSINNLKIAIHSEKISITNMEEMADSETSLSSYADKSKGFEVVNMKNTSNSVGPEELLHISSKECEGSADFGVNGMSSGASSICRKANSNDSVQLINGFHHSELVEKEREQLLAEEASSSVQVSSGGEILSKSEESCILEHQMQVEIPRTSDRVSANKSGSTAPENQPEDIMELCKFLPNLELGRSDTSESSCVSKRVARLVDVSPEKRNNEPELESKNDQMQKREVTSDIISIFAKNGKSNLKQVAHSNSFLLSERTDKWQDVLAKKSVFSANEHHPAKDISIPISLSNSKMDEISSVSNNSSHMEADHRVIDQIVYPKSGKTVPREFEHLNGTSQNSFGKRGNIKSLIECIGELPPQEPSVVRSKEIVVGGGVDRYTKRSSCVSKRVARLVDVSPEKRNNEPELESKNDQMQKKEVTSDIISIFSKNGKSNLKQVAHSNSFLLSERTDKWQDVLAKKSVFSANEHHPAKEISTPISLSNSKMDEISSVSNNSSHIEADHRVIDQIVDPKSGNIVPREFEHLNGTSQNTFGERGDIKSLIECIRELPPQEPSVVRSKEIVVGGGVDRYTKRSASNSIQTQTDKQPFDRKKRKTSSQGVIGKKENSGLSNKVFEDLNPGDERTDIGNTAHHGFYESIETKEIASLREKGNLNKSEDASLSEKLSDENKMTVKFVPVKATESDVSSAFKACGAITKVVFSSVKLTNFKVAHIYFESEEGRQKALKRSDVNIRNAVVLEATSPPKGRERMCIPDLIGYPKVPTSLVKHPSRTVIKKLKHNVSFHDIEEALAFCRSKITGIFFDLSRSVAYVEFETVEGKEIAIEKSSVIVLGERLSILRIDAPRTTVVRISNIHSPAMGKVISFCKELGKTAQFFMRTSGIMDVHFKFAEWPRMLEILNRLNGIEVDGQQLVAKPAPVYPPNVLNVLWNQPEGRKHLKTTFNSMLLKVGGDGAGTVGLTELVDRFYADVQER